MKIFAKACDKTFGRIFFVALSLCVAGFTAPTLADSDTSVTKVAMLGTGTPNPFPDRSGPSVAVVVNDEAYLVDFGPGIVRRAASLSPEYGGDIPGLAVEKLNHAFLTHLHSDHSVGLPDLLLTSWVAGRDRPLKLFGPEGTASMAKNIIAAYKRTFAIASTAISRQIIRGGASPQPRSPRLESFSKTITSRLRPVAFRTVAGPTPGVIGSQHPIRSL